MGEFARSIPKEIALIVAGVAHSVAVWFRASRVLPGQRGSGDGLSRPASASLDPRYGLASTERVTFPWASRPRLLLFSDGTFVHVPNDTTESALMKLLAWSSAEHGR